MLLLDDDPTLREIITVCLAESGYTVVPVQNGGEGVREVLASDFALVLCDFHMPSLAGDMFYRAVERIRPELCKRFVFMTGHRDDAKTNDFIRKINGLVLWKPFPMKELMEAITLKDVRCEFPSVVEDAPPAPVPSRVQPATYDLRPIRIQNSHEADTDRKVAAILARAEQARRGAAPEVTLDAPGADEPESRAGGTALSFVVAGLVFLLVLAGGIWTRWSQAQERVAIATAKRLALEAEWNAISPQLDAASAIRSKIEGEEIRLAKISADRTNPRWTPVLRAMVPFVGSQIEVLEIHARGEPDSLGGCEVRVRGVAAGSQPRQVADRFRQTVETTLRENVKLRLAEARLDRLDDMTKGAAEEKRASFVLIATSGQAAPHVTARKEGR
ncbi:MAG: response regulator [Chthoniobacteraceae bacterium]